MLSLEAAMVLGEKLASHRAQVSSPNVTGEDGDLYVSQSEKTEKFTED